MGWNTVEASKNDVALQNASTAEPPKSFEITCTLFSCCSLGSERRSEGNRAMQLTGSATGSEVASRATISAKIQRLLKVASRCHLGWAFAGTSVSSNEQASKESWPTFVFFSSILTQQALVGFCNPPASAIGLPTKQGCLVVAAFVYLNRVSWCFRKL